MNKKQLPLRQHEQMKRLDFSMGVTYLSSGHHSSTHNMLRLAKFALHPTQVVLYAADRCNITTTDNQPTKRRPCRRPLRY